MQAQDFAVHHHIHGRVQLKFDVGGWVPLGQRMVDVRAVIQAWQVSQQPEAANRSPADIFDQAVSNAPSGLIVHNAVKPCLDGVSFSM